MRIVREYYLEIFLFLLCFANLTGAGIPQVLLYPVVLGCALYKLPIPCIAFMCVNWLRDVNHAFFFLNFHVSGVAPLTVFVGLALMLKFILKHQKSLLRRGQNLWVIIVLLTISYLTHGNYMYSSDKFSTMLTSSILAFISYSYILEQRKKCNFFMLALYSTIFAIYLLQLNIIANHYGLLSSLMDFGFYRYYVGDDMYMDLASSGILYATHYQFFGTMVCSAIALLFATTKIKELQIVVIFIFSIAAIGWTGARQYIGILFLLFAVYVLLSQSSAFFKILMISAGFILLSFILYESILNDYFSVLEEQGILEGTGREELFDRGVSLFSSHKLWGVGFGGYNYYGNYKAYPHNLIIEMLAELGIIGSLILIISSMFRNKGLHFLYNRKEHFYGAYIVVSLILRSLVSLAFCQNIIIFSTLCALPFASHLMAKTKLTKIKA